MKIKGICLVLLAIVALFSVGERYVNPPWEAKQLYLEQAKAFSHGQLAIDVFDLDTAIFNNKYYVPYPPTPAILYLPFVAVFGSHSLIAYFFCFLALLLMGFLAFKICLHTGLNKDLAYYLSAGLIFGTGLWMCLQYSFSATYNSHIFSSLFVLAGLHEALIKKRCWLIGLFLAAAFTTRPFTLMSGFFMLALLWSDSKSSIQNKAKDFCLIGLCALPLGLVALAFNYYRFGDVFNAGYSFIPGFNFSSGSLFDLRFIPRNLYTMFLRGPNMDILLEGKSVSSAVNFKNGILGSDIGTSLTYASPFLLFALLAPWKNRLVKFGWIAIGLGLLPVLCFVAVGMHQLNCARYTIDILPSLFVLTALGLKQTQLPPNLFKGLVAYSILLNIIFLTPFLAMAIESYIKILLSLGT